MATSIYINTDLKDLTANAVANINRPTQVVRLPQIVEGEVADIVLHLVKSNGEYDSRSGSGESVAVAISAKGKAATSGTFKLNAGTESTGVLAWNASAEAVKGALNALNGGTGAFGSKVSVLKLSNGSYRVIFDDVGARIDMAGQSIDLAPESEVTAATSVVGSSTIRAQQVIQISQQPAIYSETWASFGSIWTGQLNANTARAQELIADGADAFFEVKIGSDVVAQVPIAVLPAVAAPNSLPAHELPGNLDAFAADPSTNGSFNPANWREDLSLVVGEDVQAWSTNLDELAAKMEWNNQELTFNILTGSSDVVIQIGQETVLYGRNNSGVAIANGETVMLTGSQGNKPSIAKGDASTSANAHKIIGLATQDIANNANGFVTLIGKVRGLTLDAGINEGDLVYADPSVLGGITTTKPAIEVELGIVLKANGNNGQIEVNINNEASLYDLKQEVPHNTDSVIICNQGDNIQAKFDEAALLTPSGNPRSATNRVTLVVMNGNYGDLNAGVKFVDVLGIGMPTIGIIRQTQADPRQSNFENLICQRIDIEYFAGVMRNVTSIGRMFMVYNDGIIRNCEVFTSSITNNYGTIKDVKVVGTSGFGTPFDVDLNLGTIDGVSLAQQRIDVSTNNGTIKNCSAPAMLTDCTNYGIIDSCKSTTSNGGRAFGGLTSGGNHGTIRNCRSRSAGSFGGQSSGGVTENCIGTGQSFAGNASFIDWGYEGLGADGTYKNCTGGNNSFLGNNTTTIVARRISATFINCTAGSTSFGWVNTVGASTIWDGYARDCSAKEKSFCAAGTVGGTTKIEADSIIENCKAGSNSFGTFNSSTNEGFVLRCRTEGIGTTQFDATAGGKVRLCLDGVMNEITLP